MPKYYVELHETFTYRLEVEAASESAAENMAYNHEKYVHDMWDDNDTITAEIYETHEREHEIEITDATELACKVVLKDSRKVVAAFEEVGQAQDYIIMVEGR